MTAAKSLSDKPIGDTRRWVMLSLGVFAQLSSAALVHGTVFLIPALTDDGMRLATAGLLVAMPLAGLVVAMIAWGAVVDSIGERSVLVAGLSLMCAAVVAASLTTEYIPLGAFLFVGGMAAGSTPAASGRVIVGWFPPHRRGLAMGIRQSAQPLGVAFGALTIPNIAAAHGVTAALLVPAVLAGAGAVACLVGVVDPPKPAPAVSARKGLLANPYRGDTRLWRIHAASVLLAIPQATVWTFALVWLHDDVEWSVGAAGVLVTATQFLGAGGRIGAGAWSDRVGSRMRPLRTIAVAVGVSMAALAVLAWAHWSWLAVLLLVAASMITVTPNGLAFTAVAEIAGPYWSGRGLGIQNTGQYLAHAAVPPVLGALIGIAGLPAAFFVAAVIGAAAVPLIPIDRYRGALRNESRPGGADTR